MRTKIEVHVEAVEIDEQASLEILSLLEQLLKRVRADGVGDFYGGLNLIRDDAAMHATLSVGGMAV